MQHFRWKAVLSGSLQIFPALHYCFRILRYITIEPPRDKSNKVSVRPAKTQISLGIRPVWPEYSLSAWRKLGSLATHLAHNEDSDQTGLMPRLIWVFAGRTAKLLVLSRGGSLLLCFILSENCVRFKLLAFFATNKTILRHWIACIKVLIWVQLSKRH